MEEHYQPPQSDLNAMPQSNAPNVDLEILLKPLKITKPWVRTFSVLGMFGSFMCILGALFVAFAGGAATFTDDFAGGIGGAAVGLIGFVIYAAVGLVYFFPSLYLWRYADGINAVLSTPDVNRVEHALMQQAKFWRFVGIGMLCLIGLYIVLFIVTIILVGITAANA